jgi:membrane protease YdiL (CAAX protease family)
MPTKNLPTPPALLWLTIAIAAFGILTAVLLAVKAWRKPPLLPYEPRRPVPWSAMDLMVVLLCFYALAYFVGLILARLGLAPASDSPQTPAKFYAGSAVEICSVAIGILIMRLVVGANRADLGFATGRLPRDIGIGALVFLASVVPILCLQMQLEKWFPYKQPLMDAVFASPNARMLISTAITAAVAAPLAEEFLFRVLLQGWFESIASRRRIARGLPSDGPAWWPIFLSAILFSLVHIGQGAAPVPLFFFAIVLGYVYQRTHRIWPSLVCHFLLNAGSLTLLWWQILAPKP